MKKVSLKLTEVGTARVIIDDREVGSGHIDECQALVDELKKSKKKTNAVYDMMADCQENK